MQCPLCKNNLEEGGLVIDGVAPGWVPMEQFQKKGLKRIIYTGLKSIGKSSVLWAQTKVENAFYCPHCNKVMGIFDVTN